jgi:RNA polymerase sigma-70 factor, ECF subfamily
MSEQTSLHVARAVRGDESSVAWLVTHFRGLVDAQVRLRLRGHGSPQDAEDAAADVWVVVLQRLADLRPREGRLAPVLVRFLGTTVLGVCNNFLRARARARSRHAAQPPASQAQPLDALADATRSLVSRMLLREDASVVDQCLQQLPPVQRDVLVLRLMEHRDNQQIAALLGVAPNTVAVRYRRALEALRERLPRSLYRELMAANADAAAPA